MNTERLHVISKVVQKEFDKRGVVGKLQQLNNALQNVVNQPQASHQQALAKRLEEVYSALTAVPSDDFSPAWRQILHEIGGADLLGTTLRDTIQEIFERHQITLATALDEMKEIHKRAEAFKAAIDQVISSFRVMGIGAEELEAGECEIGILVPREAIDNNLANFGKEISELNFILNAFSEVALGKKGDFKIRTISSTDLMVYLDAVPVLAACLAHAVERIIALYKQLLEIRKLKNELRNQAVPEEALSGIEEHANTVMEMGIQELAVEIVDERYSKDDGGRRNELKNAIRISLNKIANRIDRGYNIEVRTEPLPAPKTKEQTEEEANFRNQVSVVLRAQKTLEFMHLEGEPILRLPEADAKKPHTKK